MSAEMFKTEYLCSHCGATLELFYEEMFGAKWQEPCPKCSEMMDVVKDAPPMLNTSGCSYEPGYNWGLGKKFASKREEKEHLAKVKHETGKEFVEIGNDSLKSIKRQRHDYTYE